jgi:hypothetical protein
MRIAISAVVFTFVVTAACADPINGELVDGISPTELNYDVFSLDITEVSQSRPKRLQFIRPRRSGSEIEEPDPRNCLLLRPRYYRPSRREPQ